MHHPSPACSCVCVPSSLAGRVAFREFATPAETSGLFGQLLNLGSQLFGLMTGNPEFTDNASVSLAAVGAAAARGSSGSSGKLLLAMSETPAANYLVNPDDISTVEQVCAVAIAGCTALNCGPLHHSSQTFLGYHGRTPNGWPHTSQSGEPDCRGPEAEAHQLRSTPLSQ
jgi:hypothetical protein